MGHLNIVCTDKAFDGVIALAKGGTIGGAPCTLSAQLDDSLALRIDFATPTDGIAIMSALPDGAEVVSRVLLDDEGGKASDTYDVAAVLAGKVLGKAEAAAEAAALEVGP